VSAPDSRSPLAGHLAPGRHGAAGRSGLTLCEQHADFAEVAARRGRQDALDASLRRSGLGLPGPGRALAAPGLRALWIAPGTVLLIAPPGGLAAVTTAIEAATAAVVDQTGGFVLLGLAGPEAAAILAKGCRIDLHPTAFPTGRVARSIIAQIPAILHRVDDRTGFDLIVPSTLARSFVDFLLEAAEEVGIEVLPPDPSEPTKVMTA